MKKSLSLFVASSMVVSMFAGAAYAADAKNPGEYLNELGVIQGNGTDLKEDQSWKRQDVIVLLSRLLGEEDEAQDAETTHEFTDVTNSFYDGFISWAVEEGLVEGKGNGKFGFNAELKNQEFYAIVLRAFGHDTTGEGYAEVPDLAVKYGFATKDTDFSAIPTRGETYATIVKALETEVPGTGKKLGVILGLIKEEAPVDAAVSKVTALNATQVSVEFTAAVDKASAETAANYAIAGVNPTGASLSEDGKVVTLTFAAANQVEVNNAVLVVEQIVTAANVDKLTPKYTQVFTYEDTVKPEFVSVEAKTNNTVATSASITVSEPVASVMVKVNGTYASSGNVVINDKTVTVSGLSLEVNKTHTIELVNLTDKGGNITVTSSKTFSVVVDQVAPTATLATASDKKIVVTFSKPMDAATVVAGLSAAVKDEVLNGVAIGAVTAVSGSNNTKFEIPVTATLYTNTNTRTLNVAFPGSIKDSLGNAIVAGTQAVVLTKDIVKPAPTGYRIVKDASGNITGIEVNFSEGLVTGTAAAPTIVNSNGVSVDTLLGGFVQQPITAGAKKVVFNAATPGKVSGQYAFSFRAGIVNDQAEAANGNEAFNYTIDLGAGSTAFSIPATNPSNAANPSAAANVITVYFGTPVKGGAVANSATDLNNYTVAGKPLPAGTSITLNANQDTATITLPAGSIAKTDNTAVITIANVVALNGAALNSYVGTVPVVDNTKAKLSTAVLNADGTVTVGFDEALAGTPATTDLKVTLNNSVIPSTSYTVVPVTVGADAGKFLVQVQAQLFTHATDNTQNFTYVEVDGVAGFSGNDIRVATGSGVAAGPVSLTSPVFYSVKVATSAAPAVQDQAGITVEANVEKVVK